MISWGIVVAFVLGFVVGKLDALRNLYKFMRRLPSDRRKTFKEILHEGQE